MYEIREGLKRINGKFVDTFERDVKEDGCHLEVEAGTSGFKGGGRESGSRAYVRIEGILADMFAGTTPVKEGAEIAVCGDDEILALIEALRFAEKALIDGCREK